MRIKNFISTAALLSMAAFWVLLIARFPQPWFDRVFFFVFHLSFVGAAVLAVFALALVAVRISTPRGTAIAELISGVFAAISTLACSGLLVAAISLDPVFGVCLLSSIAAAAGCKRAAAAWKAHVTFRFYAAALPPLILFYVGVRYAAGAPPPASTIISFVIIMIAGAVFPGIIPSFNKSSLWENLVAARGAMLAAGAATALCYYSWAPALNNAGGKRLHVQSARIGGGTAMTFAPDGKHIVYLNKKKLELNLVNTITLRIEKTIPFPGGPRDIDYDPATGRYYAIRYSSPKRQLEVIDTDAFKTVTAVNLPETWCSLANAVAVDSERSRALVGCDDTGQVFFVDLKHLEKPAVRARPKLSGKGLVRIEIDKKNASALTVGCLLGPYLNEIDLKTAKA
ncbi:MAG TPA: hypothetical protein PLQ76_05240, partial [bacterium]|nr:hypothetical protein [bacterium]